MENSLWGAQVKAYKFSVHDWQGKSAVIYLKLRLWYFFRYLNGQGKVSFLAQTNALLLFQCVIGQLKKTHFFEAQRMSGMGKVHEAQTLTLQRGKKLHRFRQWHPLHAD
jgi:hypothetical protein